MSIEKFESTTVEKYEENIKNAFKYVENNPEYAKDLYKKLYEDIQKEEIEDFEKNEKIHALISVAEEYRNLNITQSEEERKALDLVFSYYMLVKTSFDGTKREDRKKTEKEDVKLMQNSWRSRVIQENSHIFISNNELNRKIFELISKDIRENLSTMDNVHQKKKAIILLKALDKEFFKEYLLNMVKKETPLTYAEKEIFIRTLEDKKYKEFRTDVFSLVIEKLTIDIENPNILNIFELFAHAKKALSKNEEKILLNLYIETRGSNFTEKVLNVIGMHTTPYILSIIQQEVAKNPQSATIDEIYTIIEDKNNINLPLLYSVFETFEDTLSPDFEEVLSHFFLFVKKESVQFIRSLLNVKSETVRGFASYKLRDFDDIESIPLLEELLNNSTSEKEKKELVEVLADLKK